MTAGGKSSERRKVNASPAAIRWVERVEQFAGTRFRFYGELASLVDLSRDEAVKPSVDELMFVAKFVTGAGRILNRGGVPPDQLGPLEAEFAANLRRVSDMLRACAEAAPADLREHLLSTFLGQSHSHLEALIGLLGELSWLQSYEVHRLADSRQKRGPLPPSGPRR